MHKILVCGASGYTGKAFRKYVQMMRLQKLYHFIGCDLQASEGYDQFICANLTDLKSVEEVLESLNPDFIINFAGCITQSGFDNQVSINAIIPYNLLDSIKRLRMQCKGVLLVGSAAEYGNYEDNAFCENSPLRPQSPYGLSKSIQSSIFEYFKRDYSSRIILARTFNFIGPAMPPSLAIGAFVTQIINAPEEGQIIIGNIDTQRDYLHIFDVLEAYWLILHKGSAGEIYNVCSGSPFSMRAILNGLIMASGKKLELKVDPSRYKTGDVPISLGNNSKLRNDTGWKPQYQIEKHYSEFLSESF